MKFAACCLLLLAAFLVATFRNEEPTFVIAAHDIPYGTRIQESDIAVRDHWYTTPYTAERMRAAVIGYTAIRNIRKGELVKNPGDVLLRFGGPNRVPAPKKYLP